MKRLPKSLKIFLRREKTRLRRQNLPAEDIEARINEIVVEKLKERGIFKEKP